MATPLSISAEEEWSRQLRGLVADRAAHETTHHDRQRSDRREETLAYEAARRQLEAAYAAEGAALSGQQQRALLEATARWSQQITALEAATEQSIAEIETRFAEEQASAQASRDETTWLVGSLLDEESADSPRQQLQRMHTQCDGVEALLQEAVRSAEQTKNQAAAYLERCRLSTEVGLLEPSPPPHSLTALQERCLEEVQRVEQPYRQLRRLWLPRLFVGVTPAILWLLISAALAVPAWLLLEPSLLGIQASPQDGGWIAVVGISGAALATIVILLLHLSANQQVFGPLTEIFAHSRAAQALFARWERLAAEELASVQEELDRRHFRRRQQRDEALAKAESEYVERTAELTHWRETEIQQLQLSAAARRTHFEQARDQELERLTLDTSAAMQEFETRRRQHIQQLETAHRERLLEIDEQFQQDWSALKTKWESGLRELTLQAQDWSDRARTTCPAWKEVLTRMPDGVDFVTLGQFPVSLDDLPEGIPHAKDLIPEVTDWSLPGVLDLKDRPALMLQYRDSSGRKAAVSLLQATMLRLLTTLPPGQVRFTILDPLSLGENFATFMHLADADELLITSRIWTEPGQIEERLADLTEHMETVLQMFLRNEFATLDEYNQQAGEVAEPYRVLVVSGLPTNFSEIALRRLWNIVTSGARCGVITLLSVDLQQSLPRAYALSDLEPFVNVLSWESHGFRWQNPALQQWRFEPDGLPEPTEFGELVKACGRAAGDVRRVEVPFRRVAPPDDALWSRSSEKGLEIPIGRSGATKTQSVSLGTGTSQHVMIAGKTGSGKSTLLHALITNAALHYSPRELELYLIDFKKGVEFKVYSRFRLPHARVIGIESDREFGVSALERLDWELQQRSAIFRDVGVADLAGFRRARPDHPMPRVLLIIDEFQEFFVEDDPLAQTASLLLDRLIRQGRAFGVHVILGSQTLAGAYSLARSTLGQVAVRIALQCSESDAHLILSEENTAARLLTRPGEAIYNDANGLSAGNHLFQVVWLDDDERERYLDLLRQHGSAPDGSAASPAIVFEGNIPADLRRLPIPEAASEPTRAGPTAWLGESVSLRGPLGLSFPAASGSHLLVVGQDESSAAGVLCATALSLSAAVETERFLVFDGSPREATQQMWREVAQSVDHFQLSEPAQLAEILEHLVSETRSRDGHPGPKTWLCLFDLARFRKLRRKDDDFGFGSFDRKEASPSDQLAEILRDGPAVGIHVLIWADSVNTVSRWLSRDMQQQFENRVAFAMNATDSSQLIDSPAASRLGSNRAWLFRGDRGTLDKFRPYSAPQPNALAGLLQSRVDSSP